MLDADGDNDHDDKDHDHDCDENDHDDDDNENYENWGARVQRPRQWLHLSNCLTVVRLFPFSRSLPQIPTAPLYPCCCFKFQIFFFFSHLRTFPTCLAKKKFYHLVHLWQSLQTGWRVLFLFSTLMATFSAFKHENVSKSGLAKNLDIVLLFSQQHLATIKTCLDSGEAGQSKTAPRVWPIRPFIFFRRSALPWLHLSWFWSFGGLGQKIKCSCCSMSVAQLFKGNIYSNQFLEPTLLPQKCDSVERSFLNDLVVFK